MRSVAARIKAASPETVWHRWARVLATFPGRSDTLPRIDVIAKGVPLLPEGDRLGWYDRDRHAVVVLDDGDPSETLHTLIHELAHAWAPVERRHHGPGWERTMCSLISWLFGVEMVHEQVLLTVPELRRIEPNRSPARAREAAFEIALYHQIYRRTPTLTDDGSYIVVSIDNGRVVHRAARS